MMYNSHRQITASNLFAMGNTQHTLSFQLTAERSQQLMSISRFHILIKLKSA